MHISKQGALAFSLYGSSLLLPTLRVGEGG